MKNFCMSSYLSFRFIKDENVNFFPGLKHTVFQPHATTIPCQSSADLDKVITDVINESFIPDKTALLLSGGIDSAILASYLPEGTKAYTFKCIADGAIDETNQAKKYADKFKLDHRIVEMYWEDFVGLTPKILKFNQVPVHSIEIQLYKAAMLAKSEGIERLIIGESADLIYGGMDQLLSKDWLFDDFVGRYTFVKPEQVLREPVSMLNIFEKYRVNEHIDFLKFMHEVASIESTSAYMHAFNFAGIDYIDPYAYTHLAGKLDLNRVRGGEPKYVIRELFIEKYPEIPVPYKIPMPRAMNQWLADWNGPTREEFITGSTSNLTGDQKWLVYCLEEFLNIFDK